MDLSWLKDYIEQGLISKTIIAFLVMMAVALVRPDVVDQDTVKTIAVFFFGTRAVISGSRRT